MTSPLDLIPLTTLNVLSANRFLAVSALACCVWDIAISFDVEVSLIWSGGGAGVVTKLVYLINRYGIPACLAYTTYILHGIPAGPGNLNICISFFQLLCLVTLLNHVVSNGYLAYHHYILWERQRRIFFALLALVAATFIPGIILGLKATIKYREVASFSSELRTCLANELPVDLKYYWGFAIAFDCFAILIAALNSLDKPYRHSSDVVKSILRDGAVWFVALSCLRFVNAVLWMKLPPLEVYVISFNLWAFTSITLSRFILRVEMLKRQKAGLHLWGDASGFMARRRHLEDGV